ERELLARDAADEAAAANFAARLEAAVDGDEVAPGRRRRFADEELAHHHAPAPQVGPGQLDGAAVAEGARVLGAARSVAVQERPAAGDAAARALAARIAAVSGASRVAAAWLGRAAGAPLQERAQAG